MNQPDLSQFVEDCNSAIFIYDTCALIHLYDKYGKGYFSSPSLKQGVHLIPSEVMNELERKGKGKLRKFIYESVARGLMDIQSWKLPQRLEERIPDILKRVSTKGNYRVGVGDKEIIALAILFKGECIRLLSTDADIPDLMRGLNLKKYGVGYIDPTLI